MSYKPSQQTIERNVPEAEFANAWREAVLGDRQTQKNFVRRISHGGV